jgi:hypothetical protein
MTQIISSYIPYNSLLNIMHKFHNTPEHTYQEKIYNTLEQSYQLVQHTEISNNLQFNKTIKSLDELNEINYSFLMKVVELYNQFIKIFFT